MIRIIAGIWNVKAKKIQMSIVTCTRGNSARNAVVTAAMAPEAPTIGFCEAAVYATPANTPPAK